VNLPVSFRSGGDLRKREMSFVVICYHADSSRTAGMNWLTLMIDARLAIFAKNYHKSLLSEKGLFESALNPRQLRRRGGTFIIPTWRRKLFLSAQDRRCIIL
jgi:hypothetical protein